MNKFNISAQPIDRRRFLKGALIGAGAISLGNRLSLPNSIASEASIVTTRPYNGPNIIIIRFGGGVRRPETIDPDHTYSPFLCKELAPKGTLFKNMEIISQEGIETSHGEGTLNILTGKYDNYKDVGGKFLGARFESKVPTVFEYLRKEYEIPEYQTLIINGEDRTDEEFYTFSNHHLFGLRYRSTVLSLYRFKTHLLRRQISNWKGPVENLNEKKQELKNLEELDHRDVERSARTPEIEAFWERWRQYYGESGLVNPRGDRLLTELAIRAMRELKPKMMMVNYQDSDYVHWGNITHYTRAIAIMDEGLQRIVRAAEANEEYHNNTIFVVVPDCGRDDNRFVAVPCQHHFGSKSAHEIFALLLGPGIAQGQVVDKKVDQISVAPTIGRLMGVKTEFSEGPVLEQALA